MDKVTFCPNPLETSTNWVQNMAFLWGMDEGRFLSQPPSSLYKLGTEYDLSVVCGRRSFSVPTPFMPLQTG